MFMLMGSFSSVNEIFKILKYYFTYFPILTTCKPCESDLQRDKRNMLLRVKFTLVK